MQKDYHAFEWPTKRAYFRKKKVQDLFAELGMLPVKFHGCAVGLVSSKGEPILKPWTIYTNCPDIIEAIKTRVCNGQYTHTPCKRW